MDKFRDGIVVACEEHAKGHATVNDTVHTIVEILKLVNRAQPHPSPAAEPKPGRKVNYEALARQELAMWAAYHGRTDTLLSLIRSTPRLGLLDPYETVNCYHFCDQDNRDVTLGLLTARNHRFPFCNREKIGCTNIIWHAAVAGGHFDTVVAVVSTASPGDFKYLRQHWHVSPFHSKFVSVVLN
jgi:hypothetical protein